MKKARRYFRDLKANGVQVFSGNKQVATAAGSGQIAIGLTDTDDAMGEIDAGSPVSIIYPDREAGRPRHTVHPQYAGDHQGLAPSEGGARPWPTTCSAPRSKRHWPAGRVPRSRF